MQCRGRRRNKQLSFLLRFSSGFISKHYIPRKEGATVGSDMSGVASNSSISELAAAAACCQEEAPQQTRLECNFIH